MENVKLEQYFDDLERHSEDIRDSIEKLIDSITEIKDNIFFHDEKIALDKRGNVKVDTTEICKTIQNLENKIQNLKDELKKLS